MSSNEHDMRVLNHLIEVTIDSMLGYAEAAKEAQRSELKDLFGRRAEERQRIAARMQEQVRILGGTPSDEGTLAATVHRVFVDLRSALSKGDEAVVKEVERGEDHIKAKYETLLKDDDLTPATRMVVQDAYQLVLDGHDQMRDLKHTMEKAS